MTNTLLRLIKISKEITSFQKCLIIIVIHFYNVPFSKMILRNDLSVKSICFVELTRKK